MSAGEGSCLEGSWGWGRAGRTTRTVMGFLLTFFLCCHHPRAARCCGTSQSNIGCCKVYTCQNTDKTECKELMLNIFNLNDKDICKCLN